MFAVTPDLFCGGSSGEPNEEVDAELGFDCRNEYSGPPAGAE